MVEVEEFRGKGVLDIGCGECVTAVVTGAGELYTFGRGSFDRLGHVGGGVRRVLAGVDRVAMGYRHGFAWNTQNKEVYGWGFNMYNQLGTLQPKDIKTPELIHSLSST